MSDFSGNEIICKKKREIELMTRDELYEKYGIPGMTLNDARLYYCIENKLDIKYFKELLELGVDLEYNDNYHNYPLWEAIKHKNDIEVIKLLKDAYYEEDVALKCHFYNPNVDCYCCEHVDNPENEENFGLSFHGSLKEYLHILYFSDKTYLPYFEIFNISPITNINQIDKLYNDIIIDFYNVYIKFSYIKCEKEEKNISHTYKKYSEFINYNNCSNEYIQLYTDIINSLKENNIQIFKEITINNQHKIDYICDTPLILVAVKFCVIEELFTYIYNTYHMYLFDYREYNWNNKSTITDLYIYKSEEISDLICILYNIYRKQIYLNYYNILNID